MNGRQAHRIGYAANRRRSPAPGGAALHPQGGDARAGQRPGEASSPGGGEDTRLNPWV